jgi:carbonic anhydrase
MRLLEAIVGANHRAVAGDTNAGLHPTDFADELPLVALSCIDVRLNALLPQALAVPPEQFIWLRNAGNIITGPNSSTMRSLALACAVKGGKEIVIIGHTDCQVGKTTTMQLIDSLKALGVERHMLPDNLTEFFGMFGSERQNVIKAAGFARQSPLIGTKVPVHGLLIDIQTGKVEWLVNGYQEMQNLTSRWNQTVQSAEKTVDALKNLINFEIGEMKFPETKIGETVTKAEDWMAQKLKSLEVQLPPSNQPIPPPVPPKIPMPPRARIHPGKPRPPR